MLYAVVLVAAGSSRNGITPFVIQITRRIKRTLQKQLVNHKVAERKQWAKFGQEKGNKPGPDRATTTVGETVTLKLSIGNKVFFFHITLDLTMILSFIRPLKPSLRKNSK